MAGRTSEEARKAEVPELYTLVAYTSEEHMSAADKAVAPVHYTSVANKLGERKSAADSEQGECMWRAVDTADLQKPGVLVAGRVDGGAAAQAVDNTADLTEEGNADLTEEGTADMVERFGREDDHNSAGTDRTVAVETDRTVAVETDRTVAVERVHTVAGKAERDLLHDGTLEEDQIRPRLRLHQILL